jgi:lipopolysaccharide/colanic/teichoic acid biosynthesis glycosyltransferase
MVSNAEKLGGHSTADDDPRITNIGKILRKYKLDELPQLLNVFLGQMSLVGPRPDVKEYVLKLSGENEKILELRPGITDWASIWNSDEGAVLAGFDDPDKAYESIILPIKIKLQMKYYKDRSFWTDLKILTYTALNVFGKSFTPTEIQDYADLSALKADYLQCLVKSQNSNVTTLAG